MNNEQQLIFLRGALKVVQDNPVTPHGYCLLIGDEMDISHIIERAANKITKAGGMRHTIPIDYICLEFLERSEWESIFGTYHDFEYGNHNYIAMRTFFAVWLEETIEEAITELIKK